MVKYWNARRVQRVRDKPNRDEKAAYELSRRNAGTRSPTGKDEIDCPRMLDALGEKTRRAMILRLQKNGTMSLSKLIEPFHMTLPAGLKHLHVLERAGLITTHKHGRVRLCVLNPSGLKRLSAYLSSRYLT